MTAPIENGGEAVQSRPSRTLSNKVLRVLGSKPCRLTVWIYKKDGTVLEMGCDKTPDTHWDDSARCLMLVGRVKVGRNQYGDDIENFPICRFDDMEAVTVEKNEGVGS